MIALSSPEHQKPNVGSALLGSSGRLFLSLLSRKTVALHQMSRAVSTDHTHVSFSRLRCPCELIGRSAAGERGEEVFPTS